MRKKSMLASDSRYITMIENAYYQVVPVESKAACVKVRPPLHVYIRHLLFVELGNKGSTNKVSHRPPPSILSVEFICNCKLLL